MAAGSANPHGTTFDYVQDQHSGLEMWACSWTPDLGSLRICFVKLEGGKGLVLSPGPEKVVSCILKKPSSWNK